MPPLGQFLGSTAGLSGPVITKLTETWKNEQRSFAERDLSSVDYVYLRADGIHVNIRTVGQPVRAGYTIFDRRANTCGVRARRDQRVIGSRSARVSINSAFGAAAVRRRPAHLVRAPGPVIASRPHQSSQRG